MPPVSALPSWTGASRVWLYYSVGGTKSRFEFASCWPPCRCPRPVPTCASTADDNAPPDAKTRWLAIFYLCIPTGYALGYIFGGLAAAGLGWRAPFLLQGAAMVPFVAFCLR